MIGVGFPKCGTTLLFDSLNGSIGKYQSSLEERHLFWELKHYTEKDYKDYRKFLEENPLEFSPGAIYCPNHIFHMRRSVPEAAIIVMLRNSIDRMFLHLKQTEMYRRNSYKTKNWPEIRRLSIFPEVVYTGLYSFHLQNLYKLYSREQILLIQYEMLVKSPEGVFAKLSELLSVDIPLSIEVRPPQVYEGVQPDLRRDYITYYRNDVIKVVDSYSPFFAKGFDLSLWTDFSNLGSQ